MSEEPINPEILEAAKPEVRSARRWNIVWVVPLVALLLGLWLLYRNFATQGPVAQVSFETADGIYTGGKTEVRCRSVKVGVVKSVKLTENLKSVIVNLELDTDSEGLLRKGTRFWVVKPRLSVTEFSGVDTIITGAYIELDPGPAGAERESNFTGLETPPATNSGVPGLRLLLTADEAGSVQIGSPVSYRGFEVGRIEGRDLDKKNLKIVYNAFIREEYSFLVTDNTRFWNTSGIDISAGADGVKLRTPSFQAMVSGGVSFGVTTGETLGKPVPNGRNFTLFRDEDAAQRSTFNPTLKFLLLFDQSVRGLDEKAPVEFRGITIGRVASFSFDLVPAARDNRIPVLVELDPSLMRPEAAREMVAPDSDFLKEAVSKGLRASLKSGSFITGAQYVDLDYYPDASAATIGKSGDYTTIPTISSGFAQLEVKLNSILDSVDKATAEIAATVKETKTTITEVRDPLNKALNEIQATAASARKTLENPEFRDLPGEVKKTVSAIEKAVASLGPESPMQGDLLRSLDELRALMRSMKSVSNTINEEPNSLLFGNKSSGNPTPKAPKGKR